MKTKVDSAVSPVIGILLMLVVTVIIAAVVSTFAGNLVQGQQNVPTAHINGVFSVQNGFTIQHAGGDSIPINDMVITLRHPRIFGPGLDYMAEDVDVLSLIKSGSTGEFWFNQTANAFNVVSFNAGDSAVISPDDCMCDILQPSIVPNYYRDELAADGYTYTGTRTTFWSLCFKNNDNNGKYFIMDVSDKATGKLISTARISIVG